MNTEILSMETQVATNALKKIHSAGYWRIHIHPAHFNSAAIPSISKCSDIIRKNSIRWRARSFPFFEAKEIIEAENWIESSKDFFSFLEYWRFYSSGQLILHRACREDYERKRGLELSLNALWTLYLMTEVYAFAGHLAAEGVLSPYCNLDIQLNDTKGRKLIFTDKALDLGFQESICSQPHVQFSKCYTSRELIAYGRELALEATLNIYHSFRGTHKNEENKRDQWVALLQQEQEKLTKRQWA